MASRKNTRKRSTNHRSKKNTTSSNKQQDVSRSFLKSEITILVTLAVCAFLMISNFGIGGFLGDALSGFMFGVFLYPIFIERFFVDNIHIVFRNNFMKFFFILGLIFQVPLLIMVLVYFGMVNIQTIQKNRAYIFIFCFITVIIFVLL